ncbi:hypothetical protein [Streptomyces ardesiacus]|uniref:hypothetical protein n=1 Tax=Streptomyces ardesiacus TaxID=285564 RepID=UPI003824287F
MTLSDFFSFSGPVATFIALAVVVLGAFRTNTAKVWKEEAEAQKARADRLEKDVSEIKKSLARIEAENKRLLELLTALDPERVRSIRI